MSDGLRPLRVQRAVGSAATWAGVDDRVAVEEPLEIRVAGEPLATTMRTPGHDHWLAVGFLHAGGIIHEIDDVGTVAHCGTPGEEGFGNVLDVTPGAGIALDPERLSWTRRGTLTTAACGICGRRTIADLLERCAPVPPSPPLSLSLLRAAPARLAAQQPLFDATGAVHGALALTADGSEAWAAEDVGRHNAVDKVVGALLYERRLGARPSPDPRRAPALLVVSGRVSFEIVQKAVAARIPVVAGVGGATSLAVDLAEATGVTLAGFVRDGALNVYAHPERLLP